MTRRSYAATLMAGLFMLVLAWTTGSGHALAQPSNCCDYTINVGIIDEENCLPITIVSDWGPGGQDTVVISKNDVIVRAVPGPCPAYLLNWISINGGTPIPATGVTQVTIGDCCYRIQFIVDLNLCHTILIRPCEQ